MRRTMRLYMGAVLAGAGVWWCGAMAQAQAPAPVPMAPVVEQSPAAGVGARIHGAFKNLQYLHEAGGGTMYFIDITLIIGVAFLLERLVRLRRSRILPGALLTGPGAHVDTSDLGALRELALRHRHSTLGRVLLYLADSADAPREEREATINEMASREVDLHRMMCFPLAAIASIAPLMGLLGTVVGIRECFRDVALAGEMGNPAMLAGGIEKALITTVYGLVVAIPTLFGYNMFKFRINLVANELEEVLSSIVARYLRKPAAR